jgi:hypothetical protein
MKWLRPVLLFLMSGCITIQSRQAFYTDELKVKTPGLVGEWYHFADQRKDVDRKIDSTWAFSVSADYTARIYDAEGTHDQPVVPFKVDERLYCDLLDGKSGLHKVFQMTLEDRTLHLVPLDGDWLTNALAKAEVRLPIEFDPSNTVFIASSTVWVKFLEEHGTNADLAAGWGAIELKRAPTTNFSPRRRL